MKTESELKRTLYSLNTLSLTIPKKLNFERNFFVSLSEEKYKNHSFCSYYLFVATAYLLFRTFPINDNKSNKSLNVRIICPQIQLSFYKLINLESNKSYLIHPMTKLINNSLSRSDEKKQQHHIVVIRK